MCKTWICNGAKLVQDLKKLCGCVWKRLANRACVRQAFHGSLGVHQEETMGKKGNHKGLVGLGIFLGKHGKLHNQGKHHIQQEGAKSKNAHFYLDDRAAIATHT